MEEATNSDSPVGLEIKTANPGSADCCGGDDLPAPVAALYPDGKPCLVSSSSFKEDKEIVLESLVADDKRTRSCSEKNSKWSPLNPDADSEKACFEERQELDEGREILRGGVLKKRSSIDGLGEEMREIVKEDECFSVVGASGTALEQSVVDVLHGQNTEKPVGSEALRVMPGNCPDKIDDNDSQVVDGSEKNDNSKKDCLPRSFAIELIDDTALIGASEFPEDLKTAGKKNGKNEVDAKEEKPQRRATNGKNSSDGSKNLPILKDPNECKRRGKSMRKKVVYTRKEMEALRYMNVKRQRKMWQEIYDGFSADVKKEYDELRSFRRRNEQCGSSLKNLHGPPVSSNNDQGLLGDSYSHDVRWDVEITSSSDYIHHGSCDGQDGTSVFEEYSEDEDIDDDYSSIQRPAFLVDGEPDFESGPPEDGWEFLRRVRWEAAQIPNVKVATLDERKLTKEQSIYMPVIPDIEKCPEHLFPLKQWEDEFLADFSELRLAVSHVVEDINNGEPPAVKAASESPQEGPTLSSLLKMDPVTRVNMLKRRISLIQSKKDIPREDCLWLFSLCAMVDTPLDADTCAALRALLRKCAKLRAEKSQLDDEAAMLNILVTISGKYFGQFGN